MIEYQLTKEDLKHPQKSGVFVYYEYLPTGKTTDMNLWEWLIIQKDPRRKEKFALIRYIKPGIPISLDKNISEPSVEDDPFQCPLCEIVCGDENSLKLHKKKKHD